MARVTLIRFDFRFVDQFLSFESSLIKHRLEEFCIRSCGVLRIEGLEEVLHEIRNGLGLCKLIFCRLPFFNGVRFGYRSLPLLIEGVVAMAIAETARKTAVEAIRTNLL